MAAAGLPMPQIRVTAECVGASKPDPEGFLKGAAELGFAPADCVVFEDSEAGIAARAGGGHAGGRRGPARRRPTPRTRTCQDLTALRVDAGAQAGAIRLTIDGADRTAARRTAPLTPTVRSAAQRAARATAPRRRRRRASARDRLVQAEPRQHQHQPPPRSS